jgi:bifunctional non-homologous end joining protein LigD
MTLSASLSRYQAKRKFNRTPEPKGVEGKVYATTQQRFVVQKHDATNLHYDLRLEYKGVMWSWAVPKGPNTDPTVRHLAARTEDHPLEYRHFEGVIPEGYGAGTVMVWDFGTFEWVERHRDHLSFILHGTKLQGEYALIKFARAGGKSWLLLKKRDRFAKRGSIIAAKPNSAVTGRSLAEIEKGAAVKRSFVGGLEGAAADSMATLRGHGAKASAIVMKPTLIAEPFSDPEWLFETKWDGFRGLAYVEPKRDHLQLISRNGLDLLERFPEVADIASGFAAHKAVVDGEIVALDDKGREHFEGLRTDENGAARNLVYKAFDLLYLDGFDLRNIPLWQRKALLRAIMRPHPHLSYTDHIEGAGARFFREVTKAGHEGMIAKERESRYESGKRTRTWFKIKQGLGQEFVIGGWQTGQGARDALVGSLLLGVYEKNKLIPVGRVGSGFTQGELEELTKRLRRLATKRSPFGAPAHHRDVHFVRPTLVAQAKFEEWTSDGQLRQPVYLGLRSDKKPNDVVREVPKSLSVSGSVEQRQSSKKRGAAANLGAGGAAGSKLNAPFATDKRNELQTVIGKEHLALTNLNKPFWLRPRILKRDVLNYYYQVAPVVLPHLAERPLTLKRYPNGATGGFFYQKNVPESHPRFIETTKVQHGQGPTRYVVCNDVETLVWLANLADLELHPWYSRVGSLNHPDFVVFDLDPSEPNDLAGVRSIALVIKDVLDHYGLKSYPKSSGSRGIHIYVPIAPRFTYDQTKQFAKRLTEVVHHIAPRQTTLEFRKAKRRGVYIDYLQNSKGKTLASAYSVRARPFASVSAPLTWDEIKKGFKIKDFTITNMPARLREMGDLFAPTLKGGQDLAPVLKKILRLPLESAR